MGVILIQIRMDSHLFGSHGSGSGSGRNEFEIDIFIILIKGIQLLKSTLIFDHADFRKDSFVDPDPDLNPDGSALVLVGRIRIDIKCWVRIRTESYADPQRWNRWTFLTETLIISIMNN